MAEDQKCNIIKTAGNLFFRLGIRSVSIDDICRELGMSKKTFYVYFESKDALIEQLQAQGYEYLDIHTNEPLAKEYAGCEDSMWYLQIDAPNEVVEPLFLEYYYDARFVYEGDLDRDGIPDFGILLKRMSNCCSYALLTIQDGRWALLKYPYGVSYNLRASGKELARRGAKKGEIIITQSDYSDFSNSDCWEAPIKDSVILYRRINAQDYFNEQN